MNNEIKYLFFDVDGTLATSDYQIPQNTIDSLKRLKEDGHHLFLSTGRTYSEVIEFIDTIGFEGAVVLDGSSAYINNELIFKQPLETSFIEKLLVFAKEKQILLNMNNDYQSAINIDHENKYRLNEFKNIFATYQLDPDFHLSNDVYQIFIPLIDEPRDEIKAFIKDMPYREFSKGIFIAHHGKERGIKAIQSQLKIPHQDIVVFGDHLNDLSMFEYAHTSVAMGNAIDELKDIASYVTTDVDDNGIANACIHFKWL